MNQRVRHQSSFLLAFKIAASGSVRIFEMGSSEKKDCVMIGILQKIHQRLAYTIKTKIAFVERLKNAGEHKKVLAYMESMIANRPINVNIEATTICNSQCTFCAYPKIKRTKEILSMELFEKICRDYVEIGGGLFGFSPLLGDPLTDQFLLDRIKLVRDKYRSLALHMFTNGIRLYKFSDDELDLIVKTLDHIDVSIGGLNRKDYQTMFGVDRFDKVWVGLERLSHAKKRTDSSCDLILHIRTHRKKAASEAPELQKLLSMGYVCNDILDSFSDWGGIITKEDLPSGATLLPPNLSQKTVPCLIPMAFTKILPNGDVLACGCFGTTDHFLVGNIADSTLQEIWTGERFFNFRDSFKRGNLVSECYTCSYYSPYTNILSNLGLKDYKPTADLFLKLK